MQTSEAWDRKITLGRLALAFAAVFVIAGAGRDEAWGGGKNYWQRFETFEIASQSQC